MNTFNLNPSLSGIVVEGKSQDEQLLEHINSFSCDDSNCQHESCKTEVAPVDVQTAENPQPPAKKLTKKEFKEQAEKVKAKYKAMYGFKQMKYTPECVAELLAIRGYVPTQAWWEANGDRNKIGAKEKIYFDCPHGNHTHFTTLDSFVAGIGCSKCNSNYDYYLYLAQLNDGSLRSEAAKIHVKALDRAEGYEPKFNADLVVELFAIRNMVPTEEWYENNKNKERIGGRDKVNYVHAPSEITSEQSIKSFLKTAYKDVQITKELKNVNVPGVNELKQAALANSPNMGSGKWTFDLTLKLGGFPTAL